MFFLFERKRVVLNLPADVADDSLSGGGRYAFEVHDFPDSVVGVVDGVTESGCVSDEVVSARVDVVDGVLVVGDEILGVGVFVVEHTVSDFGQQVGLGGCTEVDSG